MNNLIIPRNAKEFNRDTNNLNFHARKVDFYEEVNDKNMQDRHQWALDIYTDLEAAHIRLQESEEEIESLKEQLREAEEAMIRGYRYE